MKVLIKEIDNDYHTVTNREVMEFDSIEDAHQYCIRETWSGESYFVDGVIPEKGGEDA